MKRAGFVRLSATVAFLLLTAAAAAKAFKPWHFVLGVHSALGVYLPLWSAVPVVAFEFSLAGWLLSGWRFRRAVGTAAGVFVLFSLYHLYNLSLDVPRPCGCMGGVWLSVLGYQPPVKVEALLAIVPAFLLGNAASWGFPENTRD